MRFKEHALPFVPHAVTCLQGLYRNHMDEVIAFLETHHQVCAPLVNVSMRRAPVSFAQ